VGFIILKMLATPPPEPPPAGELRKVKLQYRCSLCGTEVRMTTANNETPDPPRHCMDEMDLLVVEEL
jgi:threonine dehydrogenase-like Zn-dependent dehydrogenase